MSKPNGLVIGGRTGIGNTFLERVLKDRPDINWHAPTPEEVDVRNEVDITFLIRNSERFDYIVYSAGWNKLRWAENLGYEELHEAFSVNVYGFVRLLSMHREQWNGHPFSAVALVSDAMRNPMRGSLAYCSSKAALGMAVRCLAREWAADGIRVNGVAPAVVADTPMSDYIDGAVPGFRGWSAEEAQKYEKMMLPLGRRVTKEEVAHVISDVLFGPAYVTGSIVDITGGK